MPYIKKDDFKELLTNFFTAGCNAGYGIVHNDVDMEKQENDAFEVYYKLIFERRQNEKRHTT